MSDAGAGAPTRGQLDATGVVDVFRLLEGQKATARVRFNTQMGYGEVDFVDGVIVDAYLGDRFGRPALLSLLGLSDGGYEITHAPMEPRPALAANVTELVGDNAQRTSKWEELCKKAPALSAEIHLTALGRGWLEGKSATDDQSRVLLAAERPSPLVDLLDQTQLDPVEALSVVVEALEREWLTARTDAAGDSKQEGEVVKPKPGVSLPLGVMKAERVQSRVALRRTTTIGLGIPEAVRPRRAPVQRIVQVGAEPARPTSSAPPPPEPAAPAQPERVEAIARGDQQRRFIDRYEILCRIGHGGMGVVYLARLSNEGGFRRLFALKVLRSHLTGKTTAASRFIEEARLAAHIHHPNVVPVFDAGIHEEQPYLVMDYVQGASLRELIAASATSRPVNLIVPIIVNGLAGLHAAHTLVSDDGRPLELVHCDVSPENLLVGIDGVGRLNDFGVARYGAQAEPGRATHGKPGYLAPEQVLGRMVDRRTDVFAMGVVLYNAITGVRLFEGATVEETLRRVCMEPIAPPSTVGLRPPPGFDFVCMRALERDPSRRFATADEMAEELRRIATREDVMGTSARVAEWVQAVVGPALAQRRLAVLDASRRGGRRGAPLSVGTNLSQMPQPDPGDPATSAREGSHTVALPDIDVSPRIRARAVVVVVLSTLAVIAVVMSIVWTRQVSRVFKLHIDAIAADPTHPEPPPATPRPSDSMGSRSATP